MEAELDCRGRHRRGGLRAVTEKREHMAQMPVEMQRTERLAYFLGVKARKPHIV